MDRLLRWGIENSSNETTLSQPTSNQRLDPGIIDAILGKSDAEQMKDDISIAIDTSKTEDERVEALDHLEMLIENIDNANDLDKIGLWQPLHSLLSTPNTPTSVTLHTLWVIGTAVQNNPAAQDAYLKLSPFSTIIPHASGPTKVRAKVIYALSGLLKHNAPAIELMDEETWMVLKRGLSDPDIQTRRKTIFLLNTLIIPTEESPTPSGTAAGAVHTPSSANAPVHANSHAVSTPARSNTSVLTCSALSKCEIVSAVVKALIEPMPWGVDGEFEGVDADFEEKAIRFLYTYVVECKGRLSDAAGFKAWLASQKGTANLSERWNISSVELEDLERALC